MPAVPFDEMIVEVREDASIVGATESRWISEPGGLTQFGALIESLKPGSRSSISHWHLNEDEMILVLEGQVVLHEGPQKTVLKTGDAATFPANSPVGHFLENKSKVDARYLVVGTRAPTDIITYPDHDRKCVRVRALPEDIWLNGNGLQAENPYTELLGQ